MRLLYQVLRWPVISLLLTGGFHFTIEALWPDLRSTFVPAVLGPILLAYGLWVGNRMIQGGGTYVHAIAAGAVLGVLPVALDVVGFGVILDRGLQAGGLAAIFGFSVILFGSLIGSGYALSGRSVAGG